MSSSFEWVDFLRAQNLFILVKSDDTVEVGAKLYELDTEGTPTVDSASSTSSSAADTATSSPPPEKAASEPAPAKSAESAPTSSASSQQTRSPSIKFLGKEGWLAVKSGKKPESAAASAPKGPLDVTVMRDDKIIHPMYGRPKFTEEEMEALITGGASIAPMVVAHSKGAKFQY